MQIGAQMYGLRAFTQNPDDLKQTFRRLHEIGFDMVQISGMSTKDARDIRKLLDEYAITVCGTHVPYERLKDDLDALIEEHKIIGTNVIGLGAMPGEYKTSKEGYLKFAEFANNIGSKLHKEGMIFGYHNHNFEFMKFDGKPGMDILLENTDPLTVGFIPDVYWFQAAGVTPSDYLDKLGSRTLFCHLKDMEVDHYTPRFSELGNGNINFTPILQVLNKHKIKYAVIEQDDCYNYEPFEAMEISLNYISELKKNV